jgi:predicted transcriptional regulator
VKGAELRPRLQAVAAALRDGHLGADAEAALWWYVDGIVARNPGAGAAHPATAAAPVQIPLEVVLVKSKGKNITIADALRVFADHGKLGMKLATYLDCGLSSAEKIFKNLAAYGLIKKAGRKWALSKSGLEIAGKSGPGVAPSVEGDRWNIAIGSTTRATGKLTASMVIDEWTREPVATYANFLQRFRLSKGTADRALKKLAAAGAIVRAGQWWSLAKP